MIPDRSLEVLRAIVHDFVSNNQPVGSKALLERHPLGVSAATIRNDMALLEEEQLITAPHTSSGRIPTEKGYRLFVDRLSEVKPMSPSERSGIENFLAQANDLDEAVERSARLLAQLTNVLAVVQYPSLGKAAVRHLELIPVTDKRILLMLITDSGRIQQVVVEGPEVLSEEQLQGLRARLNAALAGTPLVQVAEKIGSLAADPGQEHSVVLKSILDALQSLVDANRQEKLVLAGAANLVRQGADFNGELSFVLDAIEEQVVLLKLMNELGEEQHGVGLRIGSELGLEGMASTSVVIGGYESQGAEVAKLGVLGPTRMNYSGNIQAVKAVARYLSKSLGSNH